jgi:hypothetical protein
MDATNVSERSDIILTRFDQHVSLHDRGRRILSEGEVSLKAYWQDYWDRLTVVSCIVK